MKEHPRVRLAVVICTLRRPASLAPALGSLARCRLPQAADWSVLVVDNARCAETKAVVESFRDRLPIALLVEPATGLAHARNAAIATIACDYFMWTDDDVAVDRDWIREHESAVAQH